MTLYTKTYKADDSFFVSAIGRSERYVQVLFRPLRDSCAPQNPVLSLRHLLVISQRVWTKTIYALIRDNSLRGPQFEHLREDFYDYITEDGVQS